MMSYRKSMVGLSAVVLAGFMVMGNSCGEELDTPAPTPPPTFVTPPTPAPVTFRVTIENVSMTGRISTDRAGGAVPLSPGAWAVFNGTDPLFTVGAMADSGTRLIAEDGFPSFPAGLAPPAAMGMTKLELLLAAGVTRVGTFAAPGAGKIGPDTPAIFPGETASFTITATPGDRLQIQTMFVQSNDWFYAFRQGNQQGIALFDANNNPIAGVLDPDAVLVVYDAGTEADTAPGTGPTMPPGPVQKPVQDPMAISVGTDESVPIQNARTRHNFPFPANSEVIRVTIAPQG